MIFLKTDLLEALAFIAERTGINIVVSSEFKCEVYPPISLQARGMGRQYSHLDLSTNGRVWDFRRNAIMVDNEAFDDPELRIYDIQRQCSRFRDFPGPDLTVMQLAANGGAGGGGGGGGFDLFGGGGGDEGVGLGAEDLIDLIREAVSPDAWENPDYGMEVHSGNYLVVNAPPRLHGQIQDFIRAQLRGESHDGAHGDALVACTMTAISRKSVSIGAVQTLRCSMVVFWAQMASAGVMGIPTFLVLAPLLIAYLAPADIAQVLLAQASTSKS